LSEKLLLRNVRLVVPAVVLMIDRLRPRPPLMTLPVKVPAVDRPFVVALPN